MVDRLPIEFDFVVENSINPSQLEVYAMMDLNCVSIVAVENKSPNETLKKTTMMTMNLMMGFSSVSVVNRCSVLINVVFRCSNLSVKISAYLHRTRKYFSPIRENLRRSNVVVI